MTANSSNDNGSEPIHAADWQKALAIRAPGSTIVCDDGWTLAFGRKTIMPGLLKL
jgi:hypothetical protein